MDSDSISSIIIIIIITVVYAKLGFKSQHMSFYKLYGTKYLVRNLPDKQKAAELLHTVATNLEKIVNIAYKDCTICEEKVSLQRLKDHFNKESIVESSPNLNSSFTSYTVNKGSRIVMCIRTKDKKANLHDLNTIMFC